MTPVFIELWSIWVRKKISFQTSLNCRAHNLTLVWILMDQFPVMSSIRFFFTVNFPQDKHFAENTVTFYVGGANYSNRHHMLKIYSLI